MAVQVGAQRGSDWATAPERTFARAWGALAAALEDQTDAVVWMPAHCSAEDVHSKHLSDGSCMTEIDRQGNHSADLLAKSAAEKDRLSRHQRQLVRDLWDKVTAIATWIGQATSLANAFPMPHVMCADAKCQHMRDSEGRQASCKPRTNRGTKRPAPFLEPTATSPLTTPISVSADTGAGRRVRRRFSVAAAALRSRHTAASACAAAQARLVGEVQVARSLAALTLAPAIGPSAAERLAAVRARVRARAGSSVTA